MRTRAWRQGALASARLLAIVGASRRGRSVDAVARAALAGGARFLELRLKGRPKGEVYEAARRLAGLCEPAGALLVVNDDADVALAAGADGVHVGMEDLPPGAARAVVGPERIVGLSVHEPREAALAAEAAVDYVGIGTIFSSALKPDLAARGPETIRAVLPVLRGIPGYAIGGIDAASAGLARAAGAHGVAVASAICDADDPEAATRALVAAIEAR
jgi:thiamine-phosphate pyrophosphorylase